MRANNCYIVICRNNLLLRLQFERNNKKLYDVLFWFSPLCSMFPLHDHFKTKSTEELLEEGGRKGDFFAGQTQTIVS